MVLVESSAGGAGAVEVNSGGANGFWCRQETQWCRIRDAGTSLTFGLCFNQISNVLAGIILRL